MVNYLQLNNKVVRLHGKLVICGALKAIEESVERNKTKAVLESSHVHKNIHSAKRMS